MGVVPSESPSRFDAVLAVMGVALLGGVGVGWASALPLGVGGGAGSLVAGAALLDGLVFNPPGE